MESGKEGEQKHLIVQTRRLERPGPLLSSTWEPACRSGGVLRMDAEMAEGAVPASSQCGTSRDHWIQEVQGGE
jgi:hypothetical protein